MEEQNTTTAFRRFLIPDFATSLSSSGYFTIPYAYLADSNLGDIFGDHIVLMRMYLLMSDMFVIAITTTVAAAR